MSHLYTLLLAPPPLSSTERTHLRIDNSWLPGAGTGLFAAATIPADTCICVYRGDCLTTRQALRLADKGYLMRLGPQRYIDARRHLYVLARYINDCRTASGHNVVFDKQPEHWRARVMATREIHPGEEIFVDYGRIYWACLRPSRISETELRRKRGLL